MKRIIFCIALLFLLCGCTASYELTVNGDSISENLTLIELDKDLFDKENSTGWTIRDSFDALVEGDEFSKRNYSVTSLNTDDRLGIKYSNNNLDSLENSSVINQCYANAIVNYDNNIVSLDTGNEFECYSFYETLETVDIVFKTNHKVINNNADEIKNGKYIWHFSKDSNKQIIISYDKSITKTSMLTYIVIFGILVILGIVSCLVLIKRKENNSF